MLAQEVESDSLDEQDGSDVVAEADGKAVLVPRAELADHALFFARVG
jgi:hypothetical protein